MLWQTGIRLVGGAPIKKRTPANRSGPNSLMKHTIRGHIVSPSLRVSGPSLKVDLPATPDKPAGGLEVQIRDNQFEAVFETSTPLTEVGYATLCNDVQDVAGAACHCSSLLEGTWALAIVTTVENEEGTFRRSVSHVDPTLKRVFANYSIGPADFFRVCQHPDGYHLRNALDNVNLALLATKFARVHLYIAIEALRNSVASGAKNKAVQWEVFRSTVQVTQDQINKVEDHALRHGDFQNAVPLSGAEFDVAKAVIAEIISKYVVWFRQTKLRGQTP